MRQDQEPLAAGHHLDPIKVGRYHHRGEAAAPANLSSDVDMTDEQILREFAEGCFPEGAGPTMSLNVCMFTNTPDEHFIVDLIPDEPGVVLVSPCSGHGFKFASLIGEVVADLAINGATSHDINLFRLDRFARQ